MARKWRPRFFSELIGQEHIATTLLNALRSARMPHALLFTGPRGVGKTSAARILAKSLRCPNAQDFIPCDKCSDCLEIAQGRSIDVIEIDGASNNGVENIRELRETVGYMPSKGKYKIYIIDEVHMLSTSAFNALLKTLEEPPPHVIFVFATTEPQKIPVTILSRTQRFDFRRVPVRKVVDLLNTIIKAEGVTAEPEALWLIGRESEGSLRDSHSLLDQVITFCGKKITHKQVIEILGLTDRTILSETLKALIARDVPSCLGIIERIFNLGYDPKQFAQDLLGSLRNLMIVKVSIDGGVKIGGATGDAKKDAGQSKELEFLDLPDQEIDELKKFSENLSEEDVHSFFDMTLKGATDVMRAQDPRIVLEMLLLRLTQAPRLTSIEKVLAQLNGQNPPGKPVGSEAPIARAGTPQATSHAPQPSIHEKWAGLVEHIKREKPLLGAKLEYAVVHHLDSERLAVGFKKEQEFVYQQVSQNDVVEQLMELVGKHWGRAYKVEVKLLGSGQTQGLSPVDEKNKRQKEADEAIRAKVESHPLVKEAKNVLKAKITSIKESKESK